MWPMIVITLHLPRYQGCCRPWGCQHPQILVDQLTLSQPGGQIMPNYYWHPRIFRPSDGPEIMRHTVRKIGS